MTSVQPDSRGDIQVLLGFVKHGENRTLLYRLRTLRSLAGNEQPLVGMLQAVLI